MKKKATNKTSLHKTFFSIYILYMDVNSHTQPYKNREKESSHLLLVISTIEMDKHSEGACYTGSCVAEGVATGRDQV